MPERHIKVVCGLNNETSILLKERLQEAAAEKGLKLQIVSRYRKEGVYQYVTEHPEYQYVILQEILQSSSPYTAEDVALLTEERDVRVIIVLNKNHAGNRYMRVLYAAGILDALYEEDAYAEKIAELLCRGRTRKEARRYYGIESAADVEKAMQIIDEDRLKSFLSYIESGGPYNETISRYEFVATRMTAVENLHLIRNMGPRLPKVLTDSELFRYYKGFLEGKPKKRFGIFKKKDNSPLEPENVLINKSIEQVVDLVSETKSAETYIEPIYEEDANEESPPQAVEEQPGEADPFVNMQVSYEEESIFDLFGDGDHSTILSFIEEEREAVKFDYKSEMISPVRPTTEKKESKEPEVDETTKAVRQDTQPFKRLPKEVRRIDALPEVKIPETKTQKNDLKKRRQIPKPLILAAVIIVICLLLGVFLFTRIYGEREIPMIEEIPVTSEGTPDEDLLDSQETSEESVAVTDTVIEEPPDPSKEPEEQPEETESQESEKEEKNVQEETKENEPSRAAEASETAESEGPAETAEPAGEPDRRQQTASPSEGTEDLKTGESVEAEVSQEPDVEISREPLAEDSGSSPVQSSGDYNGKIFSGDELEDVFAEMSQKGFRVYIVTRENGEGYFSSAQIREKCDPACSFVAEVSEKTITLTEQ